jgi:2,4-dienoyl-CoA reductase-like NADH-dependent reductase (Old Yellow Enzyme family)
MSILFTPEKVGNLEIKNRFVHSGTYECMATETGEITEKLIQRYRNLAKGEVGLIITGYMSVKKDGRATRHQTGIYSDSFLPGLEKLSAAVHEEGGRVFFQLVHAGRQTISEYTGQKPMGPSAIHRDPTYLVKPREMTGSEIRDVIAAYGKSAKRSFSAGADGIHISAAAGYLPNQFLSPYHNHRQDEWGGSEENRFRFLKETVIAVKENIPTRMPLVVKISTNDHTPGPGVTLYSAKMHAIWLEKLGVDGLEIASGNLLYKHMTMWHGEVPTKEIVRSQPWWKKPATWLVMKSMEGKYDLTEPWNLAAARSIRKVVKKPKIFLVGGIRDKVTMEQILKEGDSDFIQMCRPFVREPFLVKKIRKGETDKASCRNCNRCLGAIANNIPIACYYNGLPD